MRLQVLFFAVLAVTISSAGRVPRDLGDDIEDTLDNTGLLPEGNACLSDDNCTPYVEYCNKELSTSGFHCKIHLWLIIVVVAIAVALLLSILISCFCCSCCCLYSLCRKS